MWGLQHSPIASEIDQGQDQGIVVNRRSLGPGGILSMKQWTKSILNMGGIVAAEEVGKTDFSRWGQWLELRVWPANTSAVEGSVTEIVTSTNTGRHLEVPQQSIPILWRE